SARNWWRAALVQGRVTGTIRFALIVLGPIRNCLRRPQEVTMPRVQTVTLVRVRNRCLELALRTRQQSPAQCRNRCPCEPPQISSPPPLGAAAALPHVRTIDPNVHCEGIVR